MKHKRRADAARDELVRDVNDPCRRAAELGEGVFKEVEVALGALGALVDNLRVGEMARQLKVAFTGGYGRRKDKGLLTIAVMELPLGPVTLTQAPHSAALSHTAPE